MRPLAASKKPGLDRVLGRRDLVLLFVVSYLWSRLTSDNLEVDRSSPEGQYQVGDTFEEHFTIQNRSWIPVPLIELTDFSNLPGYNPGRVFSLKGRRTRRWTDSAPDSHQPLHGFAFSARRQKIA